jgi:hypothetical protein
MAYNFKKSDVKKAIEGSGGYMLNVAKKLHCDWMTAKKYVDKYDLQPLIDAENERLNDVTEMKLMENINKGDTASIIFRLKTRAKDRGYIERQEIDHSGAIDQDVNLQIEIVNTPYQIATSEELFPEEAEELRLIESKENEK